MSAFAEGLITIILAIIGLALVSAVFSSKANTANIIQASASGLGNDIAVAQSPISGNSFQISLGYPSSSPGANG
jgi:hypothetical protein